jgi:hypothetical protein
MDGNAAGETVGSSVEALHSSPGLDRLFTVAYEELKKLAA